MNPTDRIARVTGLLYLVIIFCAGFSEGYVRATLIVPGDATATANNIVASEMLFRAGFVTDLIAFLSDTAVSVLLFVLLAPVNRTLSLVAAAFRLIAHPAIAGINMLNHFGALLLLSGSTYLSALETDQLHALSMLLLEAHGYGYLIGGAFFGVHLLLLGHLVFRAGFLPAILGVLLGFAGAGYLIESFGMFLAPSLEAVYTWIVTVTAVIGELSLCLWLLVRGAARASASGARPVGEGGEVSG